MDDETLLHAMRGLLKHLREEEGEPHRTTFQVHMLNYWASAVATEIERLQDDETDPGWVEDQKDMARIAREWDEFDRDPPGS